MSKTTRKTQDQIHKIAVITTGGTIEKSYNEIQGKLEISEFLIHNYVIEKLRLPYTELEITTLMAKDSLYMDQSDREKIKNKIAEKMQQDLPVLVVHGTDTMEETANFCAQQLQNPQTAVVFTGSMRPIGFIDSDGQQNMAEAMLACKLLPPGIYISFHNEIYPAPTGTKKKSKGTFGIKS